MKDMLGVEVEVGDIVLSCAATSRGLAKLGRVYGFDKNSNPLIEYMGDKYNYEVRKYEPAWQRGSAGSHVLVVGRESLSVMSSTPELTAKLNLEYPSASQLG